MAGIIIVINPGSTSIRMALFERRQRIADETIIHPPDELAAYDNVVDQFNVRMKSIDEWLISQKIDDKKVVAVAGRGAPLRPLEDGMYKINERMLNDLRARRYSNHASNLGAFIADHLGRRFNVPAVVVEPVTVDNFTDYARVSGVPEIERISRSHALNIKEVCRRKAEEMGYELDECNFIAAHMGGGISVAAVEKGKIVDVNDALLGMGPFSPNRAGALPIGGLVNLAFSGKYTEKQLLDMLSREAGLQAYLGESDLRKVEKMIEQGDRKAELYFRAMIYQIAKEVGMCAAVLKGKFEAIVLTGGMANSKMLVGILTQYVSFLGRVTVYPGEFEMEALVSGAIRVLEGKEIPKEY